MFAVCVTFELAEGQMDRFWPLMKANAAASLRLEDDCHQFDVCREGDVVFLYELYTDRAAFDRHLQEAHFRSFDSAVQGMIDRKDVSTYTTHWAPSQQDAA